MLAYITIKTSCFTASGDGSFHAMQQRERSSHSWRPTIHLLIRNDGEVKQIVREQSLFLSLLPENIVYFPLDVSIYMMNDLCEVTHRV